MSGERHVFSGNSGILTDWMLHKIVLNLKELGYVHFSESMKDKVSETIKILHRTECVYRYPNKIDPAFVRKHTKYCKYVYPQYFKSYDIKT